MPDVVWYLLALAAIPIAVTAQVLQRRSLRRNTAATRRTQLAVDCFSSRQDVLVQPYRWQLTAQEVRMVAAQRGYVETPPPQPDALVFRYAPDAVPQQQPVNPGGTERLTAELAAQEFAWVTLSEVGGTVVDVDTLAQHYGAKVLRSYGSHLDPVLLVGKRPISSLSETVGLDGPTSASSAQRSVVRNVVAVVALAGLLSLMGWFVASGSTLAGWTTLAAGPVLIGTAIVTLVRLRPAGTTTARMSRLIQEFDGRQKVVLVVRRFGLDRLAYVDVANELGYQYSNYHNSLRPTTRWYEGWAVYVRAAT